MWHLLRGRTVELTLKLADRDDENCTFVDFMLWDWEAAGGQPDISVTVTQADIPEDKSAPDWDAPTARCSFKLEYTDIKTLAAFLQAAAELIERGQPLPRTTEGQGDNRRHPVQRTNASVR